MEKNLNINLNQNIHFLYKKNFFIFELNDFLDEKNYNLLYENFPLIPKQKLKSFELEKNNKKFFINSREEIYTQTISQNKVLMDFHNLIFSRAFFNFFFRKLKFPFLISRLTDLKFLLKQLLPIKLNNEKKFLDIFHTHIKTQIEYSYMFNGGKIVPHTDSRHKLLSLLLFFPDKNEDMSQQEKFGTAFWDSETSNIDNEHLSNEKEIDFKNKSKKLFQIPFTKMKLFGFIGNDKSWHSVESFFINEKYIRKSININFYF